MYVFGRYVATELRGELARSLRSDRALVRERARSLRSDRAMYVLGRYVATSFCAGCYVATLFASFSDFS
ncbi:hypothetical protein F2Q68_00016081 [Brassica cretica]|uniref:Uncharacterized protein n=1 Tax=Brassica cretica TaxID=69181 RepID=A0A8S9HGL3_BRACR|nr:hypothetical protein F2Q68_00016081 [Brassica cretica]